MGLARTTLHGWAWRLPLTEIAEVLGVSSAGLKKVCVRFDIPVPPRGYWRLVETGKATSPIPLPQPEREIELPYLVEVGELESRALRWTAARALRACQRRGGSSREVEEQPVSATSSFESLNGCGRIYSPADSQATTPAANRVDEAPARADPFVAYLANLARVRGVFLATESLLKELELLRERCDPPSLAVLTLFMNCANTVCDRSVAEQVLETCRRVALGSDNPDWWQAISRRRRSD
jgi:hypothetical protein